MIGAFSFASLTTFPKLYTANPRRPLLTLTAWELTDYLTGKTIAYTDKMMKRWDKLAKFLIVKHNDQVARPSKDGEIIPGRHTSPAYSPVFIDAVKAATGDRYVRPEVKK